MLNPATPSSPQVNGGFSLVKLLAQSTGIHKNLAIISSACVLAGMTCTKAGSFYSIFMPLIVLWFIRLQCSNFVGGICYIYYITFIYIRAHIFNLTD